MKIFSDRYYLKNNSTRVLVRELIVKKSNLLNITLFFKCIYNLVLYPLIDMLSEPDYLNQKLIDFITSKENTKNNINRTFSYENYEDVIKTIKTSSNLEELTEIHYKIMNELMQATIMKDFLKNTTDNTVSNVNYNSGIINCGTSSFYASFAGKTNEPYQSPTISKSNSLNQEKNNKGDMLKTRDLKKYIKQLRFAKNLCQKRLTLKSNIFLEDDEAFENRIKNRKVLKNLLIK